jgi:hypothetical protein
MKTNPLEILLPVAKSHGFKIHFYVDRLRIYFDARIPESDLLRLKELSPKNMLFRPCTLEHYIHLNQRMELFQLDDNRLKELKAICEASNSDYKITYLELAVDFSNKSRRKVNGLRQFFNKHLVNPKKRKSKKQAQFCDFKDTHYYNNKNDLIRMALYSKKRYRWDKSRFCVHLEYRYKGLKNLEKLGILTVNDIVAFDHQKYWQQQLDLRKPNFKAIGEYLAKKNKQSISNAALNKKANKFFNGLASLQEWLKEHPKHPKLETLFPVINTPEALKKFMDQAFLS